VLVLRSAVCRCARREPCLTSWHRRRRCGLCLRCVDRRHQRSCLLLGEACRLLLSLLRQRLLLHLRRLLLLRLLLLLHVWRLLLLLLMSHVRRRLLLRLGGHTRKVREAPGMARSQRPLKILLRSRAAAGPVAAAIVCPMPLQGALVAARQAGRRCCVLLSRTLRERGCSSRRRRLLPAHSRILSSTGVWD